MSLLSASSVIQRLQKSSEKSVGDTKKTYTSISRSTGIIHTYGVMTINGLTICMQPVINIYYSISNIFFYLIPFNAGVTIGYSLYIWERKGILMCSLKIIFLEKKKPLTCSKIFGWPHGDTKTRPYKQGFLEVRYTRSSTHFPVTQDAVAFVEIQRDTE